MIFWICPWRGKKNSMENY